MGGVVVEDGVDGLASRDLALDGVQEADELLMPVALHAAADDLAFQHVEGGEQGGRAMSLVDPMGVDSDPLWQSEVAQQLTLEVPDVSPGSPHQ